MTDSAETLDALRREIDQIDRDLHALIMRRAGVVQRIGVAKGRSDQPNFVPDREARLMRELLARHEGPFPPVALLRIWREMVSAFAALQGPFTVLVHEDGGGSWDLARDHFGSHSRMSTTASARDVVGQVSDGRATVGVLAVPTGDAAADWWTMLRGDSAPRIVLRLPFLAGGNARGASPEAFAIVRAQPASTGDDRSLLVLEGEEALSRAALVRQIGAGGFDGRPLAVFEGQGWFCLAEVAGFVAADDARLAALVGSGPISRATAIGAYASPVRAARPRTRAGREAAS